MFKFFRKSNKNAVVQPRIISDYGFVNLQKGGISSTAFACMDRIASEFALLNCHVYDARTKQRVSRHPLYALLSHPNAEDNHYNFFYQSAIDYFHGGCFWLKAVVGGEVVSLFRLNPAKVSIRRDADTNRRIFEYNGKSFTDRELIYIPARFDYSTLTGGKSIFKAAQSAFDVAASLDTFTESSFTNGVIGNRIVIDVSGAFPNLTVEQAKEIKDNFQKEYGGLENGGRPILKKKGIEYAELKGTSTADNQTAELSENRKFQEHEISKLFGVPAELLSVDFSKNGNLENIFTVFAEFAVRPLATQFQEAINSLLDEERHYLEFDFNGIMKVSMSTRIDAYTKQINNGLLSPNEARAKENLEPIEAGDNHFMPVNLMPLNNETVKAYMAKQKNEINNGSNPTDEESQHFGGGDDKQ